MIMCLPTDLGEGAAVIEGLRFSRLNNAKGRGVLKFKVWQSLGDNLACRGEKTAGAMPRYLCRLCLST